MFSEEKTDQVYDPSFGLAQTCKENVSIEPDKVRVVVYTKSASGESETFARKAAEKIAREATTGQRLGFHKIIGSYSRKSAAKKPDYVKLATDDATSMEQWPWCLVMEFLVIP